MGKFDGDFIQYNDKKVKEEKKNLAFYLTTRSIFYIVLLFFAIFFIWYTYFIATHKFYAIEGVSMMSTLNNRISEEELHTLDQDRLGSLSFDAVYVDQMTKPKLFDIVVIERPKYRSVIKRLMAVEGDYVTIAKSIGEDGQEHFYFHRIAKDTKLTEISDADTLLQESGGNGYSIYSRNDWDFENMSVAGTANDKQHFYEQDFYDTYLAEYFEHGEEDGYFVSEDGLVYCQVPTGYVFFMGDNRGHSTDARVSGFCSTKYIVGRAEFIVYDYNFGNRLWEVVKFYFREMQKFFAR